MRSGTRLRNAPVVFQSGSRISQSPQETRRRKLEDPTPTAEKVRSREVRGRVSARSLPLRRELRPEAVIASSLRICNGRFLTEQECPLQKASMNVWSWQISSVRRTHVRARRELSVSARSLFQ